MIMNLFLRFCVCTLYIIKLLRLHHFTTIRLQILLKFCCLGTMEVLNLVMVSLNKSFCKPKLNKTLLVLTV